MKRSSNDSITIEWFWGELGCWRVRAGRILLNANYETVFWKEMSKQGLHKSFTMQRSRLSRVMKRSSNDSITIEWFWGELGCWRVRAGRILLNANYETVFWKEMSKQGLHKSFTMQRSRLSRVMKRSSNESIIIEWFWACQRCSFESF